MMRTTYRVAVVLDPNHPDLPSWPPYESSGRPILELSARAEPRPGTLLDEQKRQFLRGRWEDAAAP